MKKHILNGILLIGALALGSCSTSKLAANSANDDDVYYTKAQAGDRPQYAEQPAYRPDRENQYTDVTPENDDEYYYDDSYANRINRFGYSSPFGYYDDYYYNGYATSPYYGGFGYSPYGYGFGLGYGWGGYGYGGWGLGFGLGWGGYYGGYPYYGYGFGYPYGYGGFGYGYGGYGGWGLYSAYRNNPRPYVGSGIGFRNGATAGRVGVIGGRYPGVAYGGRASYGGRATTTYGGRPTSYGGRTSNNGYARPQTYDTQRPTYQPQRYSPPAVSNSGNGGFGGGGFGGGGRSGGGRSGGGRP